MLGFRFSLTVDFGLGAATRISHGDTHVVRTQRSQGKRRALARPLLPLPEDLGQGPLERDDIGRGLSEQNLRSGARQ